MSFFLFSFYLVCYSAGLAALVLLRVLASREKNPGIRREFLLLLSLGCLAFIETYAVFTTGLSWDTFSSLAINALLLPGSIGFYVWAVLASFRSVRTAGWPPLGDRVLLVLTGLLLTCFPLAVARMDWVPVLRLVLVAGLTAFQLLVYGSLLAEVLGNREACRKSAGLRMARAHALLSLALLPFLLLWDWGYVVAWKWMTFEQGGGLMVGPLWFGLAGVVGIRCRGAQLFRKPPDEALPRESWRLSDPFCARYQISDREREVADLLLAGRSYAEMAQQLFISLATVKSHVLKLYRKTGVNSKMALLNLLQAPES